jgi:hypothetical protein
MIVGRSYRLLNALAARVLTPAYGRGRSRRRAS